MGGRHGEHLGDEGSGEVKGTLLQDVVYDPLEQGVPQILDGREQEGLLGPLGDEEADQLSLWSDVSDELEHGFASRALGADHVDGVAVDEAVPDEPDPVALPDLPPRRDLGNLVVETETMADLKS